MSKEMKVCIKGMWKSKCGSHKFNETSAIKEILNNLFSLGAENISVGYTKYTKSSFEADIWEVTSDKSKFLNEKEFNESLELCKTNESGENNNFGDGRKSPLMIAGNILTIYGDTTLNTVVAHYSSKDKNHMPLEDYTDKFIEDNKDKILSLYNKSETFIRFIRFERDSKSLEEHGIDQIRPLQKCCTKSFQNLYNVSEKQQSEFVEKEINLKKMIERDYAANWNRGLYFQGEKVVEKPRFKEEYVKVEQAGDKDLITFQMKIYKEERKETFEFEIYGMSGVPEHKEIKGWLNIKTKKLKEKKTGNGKGLEFVGQAEIRVYYIDKSIPDIETGKEDQTIAIFREGLIIADVPLRHAFPSASQLRTDFVYQGSDDIFELRPNKTKTTFKPKVMDLILKLIRYGTEDIFPSYKDKGKTSEPVREPVPNVPAQEQVPGPAPEPVPEPDNDPNQEGRKELNGEDKEKSWDKLYREGRNAICVTCKSQKINCLKTDKFQWAHILAHSKGGECNIDNMIPICRNCNSSMGNTHMFIWVKENKSKEVNINFREIMRNYSGEEKYREIMSNLDNE